MLPDRVSNPGPLTYKSGALPIALRGPAFSWFHATVGKPGISTFLVFVLFDTPGNVL